MLTHKMYAVGERICDPHTQNARYYISLTKKIAHSILWIICKNRKCNMLSSYTHSHRKSGEEGGVGKDGSTARGRGRDYTIVSHLLTTTMPIPSSVKVMLTHLEAFPCSHTLAQPHISTKHHQHHISSEKIVLSLVFFCFACIPVTSHCQQR